MLSVLVDSGATLNLIDLQLHAQLNDSVLLCEPVISITAVDGQPIGEGISQCTAPLHLRIDIFHEKSIVLHVLSSNAIES